MHLPTPSSCGQRGDRTKRRAAIEPAIAAASELGTTFLYVKLAFIEALEAASMRRATSPRSRSFSPPSKRSVPATDRRCSRRMPTGFARSSRETRASTALRPRSSGENELVFDLAVALLEHGEATGSDASVTEAREIFERLGATPWLERASAGAEVSV